MMQRRPHIIKSNKTVQIGVKHLFVDTETFSEKINDTERYEKFKLGWALLWNRHPSPRKREFEWYFIEDVDKFWLWLDSRLGDKEKITWWSHNTDFDFRVLNGYVKMKELGYDLKRPIVDSQKVILTYHKPKHTLLVLDTFNFFKMSLKDIGESIGVLKGKVDFNTVSDANLKVYCKQDVTILYEIINRLIAFIKEHDLGTLGKTVASQAYNGYRHRFMQYPIYVHTNPNAINLERKSYRGGRCEAFFIGDVSGKKLHYLDVNSMYPYAMYKYEYPTKLIRVLKDVSVNSLKKMLDKYHVIADINFTIDIPGIGVKTKRLMFPTGVIDAAVCTEEIKYILKHGVINKIRTVALYESEPIFKDYVTYFYNLKKKYKKEDNKAFALFAKYMLNSLYGKFGQRVAELKEIVDLPAGSKEETVKYFDVDKNRWATEYHFNNKAWIRDGYKESFDTCVAIASEVAANARLILNEYISIAGRKNVYYTDTDSIMVNEIGYDKLKDYIDDTKLGMLGEVEMHIKGIYGAKWYETDTELKLKGIKKNAVKIGKNRWKQEQFERFNTGLRKGDLNKVRVKDVKKTIKSEYNKGVVTKDGRVKPYVLVENNMTMDEIREKEGKELREREKALDKMEKEERKRVKTFMRESDKYDEDSQLMLKEEKEEDAKKQMMQYI